MHGFVQGRQRVGGFAGLRNHDGQRVRPDDRIAIAEFAAVIDFDGNPRQPLDHELAGQRRVPTGAAGDDAHLAESLEVLRRNLHLVEEDSPGFLAHAAQRGVAHRARLLKDFLEHEVLVAALFGHDRVPQNVRGRTLHRAPVEIGEMHAVLGQHRHVAVGQEDHVARVAQDRRHIGGHEIFAVAQPDHHRRPGARGHDLIGILARDHAQREHAGQLAHRVAHRVLQIPVVIFLDQMRDHLGVGLGDEGVAFGDQLALQRQIIFDDAVVHHHDVAVAIAMRMRVFLGGAAVRRPARVADAVEALHRIQLQHFFQVAQLAGGAPHRQAAVFEHRETSRIVAAVFQPLQAVKNDGDSFPWSDVADNSAHSTLSSV